MWISVNDALPIRNMVVRWLCSDGIEDIGYFYEKDKTFASLDLCSSNEITHWKPSEADVIEASKLINEVLV